HKDASVDGQRLMGALLDWMRDAMPLGLKHLPAELVCFLIGDEDAALLGCRRDELEGIEERVVADVMHVTSHIAAQIEHEAPARRAAEAVFHLLVDRIWDIDRRWNRELFAIPPTLQQSWRLRKR